ncbi:alanyl-tRNA editing protein [Zooshikella harenae]|uniref:Alanine--tRNA ligase n=1 Tax=Zooshikella harenae TaxID=2827238 RepID=A0ABS5ZC29_9GAMM|nr:alanyl-tRNA editing protein [Zooshikella harenae]MBU2711318.1 alanyl-tRNA editing protein [Zooshikella harenae]
MEMQFLTKSYAQTCATRVVESGEGWLRCQETVFYPQGGGQLGDTGKVIVGDGSQLIIVNTLKGGEIGQVVHYLQDKSCVLPVGLQVNLILDWQRRYQFMQLHTALHVLSAVLPFPVTGCQINETSARIDLACPELTLTKEEITKQLNDFCCANYVVSVEQLPEELLQKQLELVKTMSVKPPAGVGNIRMIRIDSIDYQPCGGTHVANTGEIPALVVSNIKSKGKQNRRVTICFAEEPKVLGLHCE